MYGALRLLRAPSCGGLHVEIQIYSWLYITKVYLGRDKSVLHGQSVGENHALRI